MSGNQSDAGRHRQRSPRSIAKLPPVAKSRALAYAPLAPETGRKQQEAANRTRDYKEKNSKKATWGQTSDGYAKPANGFRLQGQHERLEGQIHAADAGYRIVQREQKMREIEALDLFMLLRGTDGAKRTGELQHLSELNVERSVNYWARKTSEEERERIEDLLAGDIGASVR